MIKTFLYALDLTIQFHLSQAVAMVCGFMVVVALAVAAFFSFRTRSKIWHYGKPNIYWDRPLMGGTEGRDVEDWVSFHITTYAEMCCMKEESHGY